MMTWTKPCADKLFYKFSIRKLSPATLFRPITHRKHEATEFLLKSAQQVLQDNWAKPAQCVYGFDSKLVLRTRQSCGIVVVRGEYVRMIEHELRVFRRNAE